jgi:hypothetical protein
MPSFTRFPLAAALAALLMATSGLSHAQLDAAGNAQLAQQRQSPEYTGALIYRGATFSLKAPTAEPLFRYERRVGTTPRGLSASHATSDPKGELLIVETAEYNPGYELQRFEVANKQGGFSGSVLVSADGHHLQYNLNDNGKISTAKEEVNEPVVTGPSMFGFILKNWDSLKAGNTIPVRMVVLREKTTYGFDVRFEQEANGQTSFSIVPSSFIIRLAIAPLRVVFDTTSRNARRYEGRVPPMEAVAGKLKDLDARVDYTMVASSYR